MKEITSEELGACNGRNGKSSYVSYRGRVYDVSASRLWSAGIHMNRHHSGKDLSRDISAAPHGPEVLDRYPQVGIFKKGTGGELTHLPSFLQTLLQQFPSAKRHPHPVMVHFPIAFLIASSLFLVLHLVFKKLSFEICSYYLIILGTIASPFTIATGFLTWWINYRLRLNRLVKRKIQLSVILVIFEIGLVLWRSLNPEVARETIQPVYLVLVLSLTPLVLLLGYFGGQLTFPSGE